MCSVKGKGDRGAVPRALVQLKTVPETDWYAVFCLAKYFIVKRIQLRARHEEGKKTHKNKVAHGDQSGEEASLHRHADDLEYDCLSTGAHVSGPVKRDAQNTGDGQVRYRGLLGSASRCTYNRASTHRTQPERDWDGYPGELAE